MGYYRTMQSPAPRAIPPGIRPAFGQVPTIPATVPGCAPCPPGHYGCAPMCYPDPAYVPPAVPGAPSLPPVVPPTTPPVQCPSGTTWAPGLQQCVPFPPGVEPEPAPAPAPAPAPVPNGAPVQAAVAPGWWGERTDLEKGLLVGGSALVAVGLLYAVAS